MTDQTAQDVMCLYCGEPTPEHPLGRPRLYCSPAHRIAAHRARKRADAAKAGHAD